MKIARPLFRLFLFLSLSTVFVVVVTYLLFIPNPKRAEAERYAVLSAYIEPGLTGDSHDLGVKGGLIVIRENTVMSAMIENPTTLNQYRYLLTTSGRVKSNIPQLRRSVWLAFLASNVREKRLKRRFSLPADYELTNEETLRLYPSELFFKRFPNSYGFVTFSQIGFNRDLTEAIFYTEHICGLCGDGKYVFMRKVNGKWTVEGISSTWVS